MMDRTNVGKIDSPVRILQIFEKDGVHFKESSGKVYVEHLAKQC